MHEASPECHFNLASAFNDVGNHQGAVIHYKRAIELDDKNADAYYCLGGVYETLKQMDKAERYYKIVLQKEPENEKAREALKKMRRG